MEPWQLLSVMFMIHTLVSATRLTSVDGLDDSLGKSALVRLCRFLIVERLAPIIGASRIHSALERIALPAKDVISVLRVALPTGSLSAIRSNRSVT
jgi:hypothetical protein